MKEFINPEAQVIFVNTTEVIATSLGTTTGVYDENDPTLVQGAHGWDEEE